MIEAEQAFAEQSDNMRLQEGLLAFIAGRVDREPLRRDEDTGQDASPHRQSRSTGYPTTRSATWQRRRASPSSGARTSRPRSRGSSRWLTSSPFFITDYPLSARSFYHMTYEDRPKVTKSADLIAPEGFGELATGGQRIASYDVLMERIRSQDLCLPRRSGGTSTSGSMVCPSTLASGWGSRGSPGGCAGSSTYGARASSRGR